MKALKHWIALAAMTACSSMALAAPDGLLVRVAAPQNVLSGDVNVEVSVSVTNTTRNALNVLRWELPSSRHDNAVFDVQRDGVSVAYTGRLVKRGAPTPADYVLIQPGETLSYTVELTSAYDMTRNGTYSVAFNSNGQRDAGAVLRSEPVSLWLMSRSGRGAVPSAAEVMAAAGGNSLVPTYQGCSATQQGQLATATTDALTYAGAALSYMGAQKYATQRFNKWFGPGTRSSWNTILNNFTKIQDAFATKQINYDCSTCPAGPNASAYAYVFANQPYTIYLCNAFWPAPALGTDSKAGTLIHEMSHFTVVAGTGDFAYGQTNAAALAISNPGNAIRNADSHEYFAENTPVLP
jgi:peptidyl-Lys metalloendopeptidase